MSSRGRPSTGTTICPLCASPKVLQAKTCRACYVALIREERYVEHGRTCVCDECRVRENALRRERRDRARGGPPEPRIYHVQLESHPWHKRGRYLETA